MKHCFRTNHCLMSQDRRAEHRAATVFRPVLIRVDGFATFCLVRNLSPAGMRAKVYSEFEIGTRVMIQFGEDELVPGKIVWQKLDHIGVRFDHPIEVSEILSNISRRITRGKRNRALRLPINCMAELEFSGRTLSIGVQNISQRGLKICTSFVRPGDEVRITLSCLDSRKAIVRWTRPNMAGLNFVRPLSFDELARWVVGQQPCDRLHDSALPTDRQTDHLLVETGDSGI